MASGLAIQSDEGAALPGGPFPDIDDLAWQRQGMPDTEFHRKYPPDPWGEEAGPNARVWNIYRDLQTVSDRGMLDSWNKTLDVLLFFAGLFSAVLTAFLVESYKALQPDYTKYVAVLLYAAALSHNRTGGVLPALDSIIAPERFVQTSGAERWTNGLWFSSLVISLVVALLCILIKQWLDEHESHISSGNVAPKYWAQRHCMYHRGLETWGVPGLISFLPLLLHVSLFLFFGGLVLFLRPLDDAISSSLLVVISCIAAFYVLSLVLPPWRVDCPSYTPLLEKALRAVSKALSGLLYVIRPLSRRLLSLTRDELNARLSHLTEPLLNWVESVQLRTRRQLARETRSISACELELDGYVLSALIRLATETNGEAVNAACAAMGAVTSTRTMTVVSRKVPGPVLNDILEVCLDNIPSTGTGFAITAHAQLRRAQGALWIHDSTPLYFKWNTARAPGLRASLGIDGLLLQALGIRDADGRKFDIDLLVQRLQALPLIPDGSRGFPIRSMCMTFLDAYARPPFLSPESLPTWLLVFCAGRFASAETHELVRALRRPCFARSAP